MFGGQENHDSHRRDRILRFFLRPEIGQFFPHFGAISLLNYTVNLEKRENNPLENAKKSSGDGAPKSQISVPCRGWTCPDVSRVPKTSLRLEFEIFWAQSFCRRAIQRVWRDLPSAAMRERERERESRTTEGLKAALREIYF